MADDNQVEISFTASADDAIDGIAQVRDALNGLTAPVRNLDGSLGRLRTAFGGALPADMLSQVVKDFGELGTEAARSALQVREIGAEIKLLRQGLTEQKIVLDAEANQFQITQNQKFAMLEAETQKEYEAELNLLQQEAALGDLSVKQRLNVINQIAALEEKHRIDMIKLDEQAIAQQQQIWTASLGTIENVFNSQLRGLLAGTTSWSQAFKNVLGDIIIKFIEMCETMVVKWLAAELAQTTATTSGAAARRRPNKAPQAPAFSPMQRTRCRRS